MVLSDINQVIRNTFLLSLLGALCGYYFNAMEGLAIFAGGAWSCLNLFFIKHLVTQVMLPVPKKGIRILLLLAVKFPLLYLFGYYLLAYHLLPVVFLAIGSSFIFLVIFATCLKGMAGKAALMLFTLFVSGSLQASLNTPVPEVPSFFTLLYTWFKGSPLTSFLEHWQYIIYSIFVAALISIIFYRGARRKELIPYGLQNFVESTVELLRNFILEVIGPQGEKYIPFLGTLFLYVLCMNWLAVIPFMKPPTSSINITAALAICVFILVQFLNIRNWGLLGFIYHMAGSPKRALDWALVPLLFPIELLTQLTRPLTLALRLFGNVLGEDILIGAAATFGVYVLASTNLFGLPLQLPFMLLAVLTGVMQALVFTLLSTIYILLSMPHIEEKIGTSKIS